MHGHNHLGLGRLGLQPLLRRVGPRHRRPEQLPDGPRPRPSFDLRARRWRGVGTPSTRRVTPAQHKALLEKKVPTALKIYEGEQHGFRQAENIEDALNSELYFFSRVFGFDCLKANPEIEVFPIDNLAP